MSATLTAPSPTPPPWHYPVQVHADPQPHASRWLWLVKWLLLIPHVVVLMFLWLAFAVLSVVAFVAILATGRYPRGVFDFNVGVLRWSWRVSYYGYSALATDRYPPFTLDEVPDYPAHLEVEYPSHLSRGLVLVKWWLLALPHYVVVGILVGGGGWWLVDDDSSARFAWSGGLVGLLVLVGAVVLTVTGQFPRPLYDLVLGLNRWVLRVWAYAALMTDVYPPFRLDMGPDEPGRPPSGHAEQSPTPPTAPAPATAPTPPTTPPPASAPTTGGTPTAHARWTAGRVLAMVTGAVLVATSLAALSGGAVALVLDNASRDDGGFVATVDRRVHSNGYAVTMTSLVIDTAPGAEALPQRLLGDVTLRGTSSRGDPLFMGIAPSTAVQEYLGDVERTIPSGRRADGVEVAGGAPAVPPTELTIWEASRTGTGTQELRWSPRPGDWAVVLMNADGSADVTAQVSVGAELPWLGTAGVCMLIGGFILLLGGVVIVVTATRRAMSGR